MKYVRIFNGFSNGGTHTITSTPTTVYWYAALIKNLKYENYEIYQR
jgi:hypothetical protein